MIWWASSPGSSPDLSCQLLLATLDAPDSLEHVFDEQTSRSAMRHRTSSSMTA
jgi:hypothetical protein